MRSDWVCRDSMDYVLAALMPENQLVMECCLASGLRVSDVLNLRSDKLRQRMTVRELKTGKSRRVYWPRELYDRLLGNAGKVWVFPGRCNYRKHRTRQAVYKDIVRAAGLYRSNGVVQRGQVVTPHSARKVYAVDVMERTGDIGAVAAALNHDSRGREVTMLYALADSLTAKKLAGRCR